MISAILPVHDTPEHELRECLDSLRAARVAGEIILVDDRTSQPETLRELRRQAALGAKVLLTRGGPGQTGARCTGITAARGTHILAMDADDTIERLPVFDPHSLADVNLAENNTPETPPETLWDYIHSPVALQWGSILQADLARHIAAETENREDDIAWGYRLYIEIWRDRLRVKYPSGLRYTWRSADGRQSNTAKCVRTPEQLRQLRRRHLDFAIRHLRLCNHDREAVRVWDRRRELEHPHVECRTKPGARVDIHVLSYSGPGTWLDDTIRSLENEPCNINISMGGFPGSIGAARAFAFTLGDAEYVSFLDDDDMACPGVLQQLIDIMDANPALVGVYTDTVHQQLTGNRVRERKGPWRPRRQLFYCPEITHLKIMRRKHVMPYLDQVARFPTYEEYVLNGLVCAHGPWQHLSVAGAIKRYTAPETSSMRFSSKAAWRAALAAVTPSIMQHASEPVSQSRRAA